MVLLSWFAAKYVRRGTRPTSVATFKIANPDYCVILHTLNELVYLKALQAFLLAQEMRYTAHTSPTTYSVEGEEQGNH